MVDSIRASVKDVQKLASALNGMGDRLDLTSKRIVMLTTDVIGDAAKRQFRGERHNPPEQPRPTLRTGNLRNSIRRSEPERLDFAAWRGFVGPTVEYGRRVEMGGVSQTNWVYGRRTTKFHTIRTRPFPYMAPAFAESREEIISIYRREWRKAISG